MPRRPSRYDRLAVAWRLFRLSGSVESKYGALYCRPPGTPSTPRVRNGESTIFVDVFPWFISFHVFCEYCAVANARRPTAPRHVATASPFGVDGVVIVFGSMLAPSAGCTRSESLSMYVPCSV